MPALFQQGKHVILTAYAVTAEPRLAIEITLVEGGLTKEGTSWETTPFQVALSMSKSLADKIVIAKVDGELWDLERPFEKSSTLQLFDFDTPEGKLERLLQG